MCHVYMDVFHSLGTFPPHTVQGGHLSSIE